MPAKLNSRPKPENAAAQIKLVLIMGESVLEGGHNPAMDMFAAPVGLHDARFP
jgi:hypothetical protein